MKIDSAAAIRSIGQRGFGKLTNGQTQLDTNWNSDKHDKNWWPYGEHALDSVRGCPLSLARCPYHRPPPMFSINNCSCSIWPHTDMFINMSMCIISLIKFCLFFTGTSKRHFVRLLLCFCAYLPQKYRYNLPKMCGLMCVSGKNEIKCERHSLPPCVECVSFFLLHV